MIDKLSLKNFTVFGDCEIDFSPGVNVIIGGNGTGKTHLLKSLYCLLAWDRDLNQKKKLSKGDVGDAFYSLVKSQFSIKANTLEFVVRRGSKGGASVAATLSDSSIMEFKLGRRSKSAKPQGVMKSSQVHRPPVLIPTKEVMSFIEGVVAKDSSKKTIDRIFDGSYLELFDLLKSEPTDSDKLLIESNPRIGSLLPSICDAIGGQFEIDNGLVTFNAGEYREHAIPRNIETAEDEDEDEDEDEGPSAPQLGAAVETIFYSDKNEPILAQMSAEGHKKIGMLQYLLRNGSLVPGTTGALLWDEPEANVNPRLMRMIAETILELSRNGQQVILATHEYIFLKWFDLLEDATRQDQIRFHALKGDAVSGVTVESVDDYVGLTANGIEDTFTELYNKEIDRSFGSRNDSTRG